MDPESEWVAQYVHSPYRRHLLDDARKLARNRAEQAQDATTKQRWEAEMTRLLALQEQAGTPATPDQQLSG